MTDTRQRRINDLDVKSVENIVGYLDPNLSGLGRDHYYQGILDGAYRLRRSGMTDWLYLGQHATSTLWESPTGNGTLRVYADGSID